MSKKVIIRFILCLALFWCFVFMSRVNSLAATESVCRNVYVSNHDNTLLSDYGHKYFHVGDYGHLTFEADLSEMSLPGMPSSVRQHSPSFVQNGDPWEGQHISYSVSDSSVVVINQDKHTYRVLSGGEAVVIMSAKVESGGKEKTFMARFTFTVIGDATVTKFAKKRVTNYMVDGVKVSNTISLKNCPNLRYHSFDYMVSNEKMGVTASLDPQTKSVHISSNKRGKVNVTIILNGSKITTTIENKGTGINYDHYVMDVGDSFKLSLIDCKSKIKWKSMNKGVVNIKPDGTIVGKSVGNTVVYAVFNAYDDSEARLGCAVSVVPKGRTNTVNTAIHIGKTRTYSQPLRMNPLYYDCSSLVWQAYQTEGFGFGLDAYAPTAAEECRYCADRGKTLTKWTWDDIKNMRFLPGDCVFRVGANNGRFMGIYHVEMFAGYRVVGFDDGEPVLAMCWANRTDNYYDPCDDVMVSPV